MTDSHESAESNSHPEAVQQAHPDADRIETLLSGRFSTARSNAPGYVIHPDTVQSVLSTLKDDAGFDHLSCLTAQEYEDRSTGDYVSDAVAALGCLDIVLGSVDR